MAHTSTAIQSDDDLYIVTEDGSSSALTLPATVTLSGLKFPRFEVNGVHAIMVNTPTQPLIVDDSGIVMFFSPLAPTAAPTTAVGAAGTLSGTYYVKYTFAIRDLDGNIVAESGFSPVSAVVVLTSDKLAVSALQTLSGLTSVIDTRYEIIRRVYRTSNGTTTYFHWYDVEDNTSTSFSDDASDTSIAALAADTLGTVPYLSHIASFKERMFGLNDSDDREALLYSESGLRWAWPADNLFTLPQSKGDFQSGGTALMPRRDALGIAKSNMLIQLTGTDDASFNLVTLSTSIGCISAETAAIYNDTYFFLGNDGVYRWDDNGLTCVSDGRVRSWFTTDDYFNRDLFDSAFAHIDSDRKVYKLFLALAGETAVTAWIEYDFDNNTWWGPHVTDAYTFTSAFKLSSHLSLSAVGSSDGYIVVDTEDRIDDATTAIEVEGILSPLHVTDPPATSYFGDLSVETEPQDSGILQVYAIVGELADQEQAVYVHDLTKASESLGRLGYGRFCRLRLYHNTSEEVVQVLGMEIDPINIVGRRN